MKSKSAIAMVLVFLGANILTFATTRYWTTKHVLTKAQERMDAGLKKEGLYDRASTNPGIIFAIRHAGGMYFWWNEAAIYWGGSALLILSGLAVTQYQPSAKDSGEQAAALNGP